jgi:ethanolamine kinase
LVRIFGNGTELVIDRQRELIAMRHLFEVDLAPKIYATFQNGVVYQYFDGEVLTLDEMRR